MVKSIQLNVCNYAYIIVNSWTTSNAHFKTLRMRFYKHKQYSCNILLRIICRQTSNIFLPFYLGAPCNYPQGSYDRYSDPSTRQCRCRVSIIIIPWCCTNDNILACNLDTLKYIFQFLNQDGYFGYDCQTYRPIDNRCPKDQFYSSDANQCLDCYCFGITQGDGSKTKCQASNLRKSSVSK